MPVYRVCVSCNSVSAGEVAGVPRLSCPHGVDNAFLYWTEYATELGGALPVGRQAPASETLVDYLSLRQKRLSSRN